MSLLERRKLKINSLPLTLIQEHRNPVESLRQGAYDIRSTELSNINAVEDVDQKIAAFLEEEDVRPILLNQYIKDLHHYKLMQATPLKSTALVRDDAPSTQWETPKCLKTDTAPDNDEGNLNDFPTDLNINFIFKGKSEIKQAENFSEKLDENILSSLTIPKKSDLSIY